jgi:hypothetical protein
LTRNEAWERLQVTPAQVANQPIIGRTLSKIGTRKQIIELLQESEVPELRAVLEKIQELPLTRPMGPREKKSHPTPDAIPMEAFCLSAGVPTLKFLSLVVVEALTRNADISKLIASAAHPNVTEKTVEMALDGDLAAAKLLHQHAGFLPMPKNSVVQIFGGAQIDARQQTQVTLPPVEDEARNMTDRFNHRFLANRPQLVAPVEEDADDLEDG